MVAASHPRLQSHLHHLGPQVGWIWLALGWLVLTSVPARVGMLLLARRFLLADLRPGRYPRASWMASRLWFVERLAELVHLESLAGTPWAARYARLMGHRIGDGTRLGTIPPPTSLVAVGESRPRSSQTSISTAGGSTGTSWLWASCGLATTPASEPVPC